MTFSIVPPATSVIHVCHNQHLNEARPKRCRCRKRIKLVDATIMVEKGFAQWLITSQIVLTGKEVCHLCLNEKIKKNCQHCAGTGEVEKSYPVNTYSSDIVLVTTGSTDDDGKTTYKPVLAPKTPRVATIEKAHIERAYVQNNKEEIERIEAYGLSTLETRIESGIGTEPDDDSETWSGRNFDHGRSPYARISDERTNGGNVGSRITKGFKAMDPYEEDEDYS
jgi:hypothetical protein